MSSRFFSEFVFGNAELIRVDLLGKVNRVFPGGSEARSLLAQPKPFAVLAYLAVASPGGFRRRDELLGIFWPDSTTARGRGALSQALHVIRNAIGPDVISARGTEEIGVDQVNLTSDVEQFRAAISSGEWKQALSLYHGDLLSGFFLSAAPDFDQWLERERALLRNQATDAAWRLSEQSEKAGDTASARDWARRAVSMNPYGEEGLRRYLSLLARLGDRAEAIRAFVDYRSRLARELDIEPSPETCELLNMIRTREAKGVPRVVDSQAERMIGTSRGGRSPRPESDPLHSQPRRKANRSFVLAIAAIVVVATTVALTRSRSQASAKDGDAADRVVVAEFTTDGSDSVLASTVSEAMRLDLSRSPRIKPLSDSRVREALRLMSRDSSTRLDPQVAREVAIREGIKAVLAGDVRKTGSAYTLSARLVSAETGELLGGWRATADDSTRLIQAIDKLSSNVRKDAGESLDSIAIASPLLHVSTISLAALRKHAMGQSAFYEEDYPRALALFEEAIAIDSTFADAYMMRAVVLGFLGTHPAQQVEATMAAYRYRDRLRDAERYAVVAAYLQAVKADVPGAVAALHNEAELDPGIVFWGRFVSLLTQEHRYREAEQVALRGLRWEPSPLMHWFLANVRFRAGMRAEAERTLDHSARLFPNHVIFALQRIEMTEATGDYERASALAHAAPHGRGGAFPTQQQALLDALLGKVTEARGHLIDLEKTQLARHATTPALGTALLRARVEMLAGDTAGAARLADSIAARADWAEMDPRERPYLPLAHFYLMAGRNTRAAFLLTEFERVVPQDFRARDTWLLARIRGMFRAAAGDRSAITDMKRVAQEDRQPTSAIADLHWAYSRLGMTDAAVSSAQAYLSDINAGRTEDDAFQLAAVYRFLSDTHAAQGRADRAEEYRQRLAKLWRRADPVLRRSLP